MFLDRNGDLMLISPVFGLSGNPYNNRIYGFNGAGFTTAPEADRIASASSGELIYATPSQY